MELFLIYLFIAVFFSFLCSILESVLLSVTPAYISIKIEEGKKVGQELKTLKENIDKPLAAILTLNTFSNTLGAAGVGAQAQALWGNEYLSLISILLTITILIFSEIIPKTLGASYWQQLAPFSAPILKLLIYSPLYPVIIISQYITKILKSKSEANVLSKADFLALAKISAQQGLLRQEESLIIQNLFQFSATKVEDIMTPRTVMQSSQEDVSIKSFHETTEIQFSRIPVYEEDIDHITGYVLKNDILYSLINKEEQRSLQEIKRKILVVYQHLPLHKLFNRLVSEKEHIAVVSDEYGGTAGIVTMEDILETLLGLEIMDELDNIEDMQLFARKVKSSKMKAIE